MIRPVNITLQPHETEVMPGLSVTPADMEHMTAVGRSVASHQMDQYYYHDGYRSPSDLPEPLRRGRDINENWEMMQRFKGKVKNMRQRKALEAADAAVVAGSEGKE